VIRAISHSSREASSGRALYRAVSRSSSCAVIVVRGDDGHAYYADVAAARRYVLGTLSAGSPTALLGLQGVKPHEIVAIAFARGDATALSRAIAEAGPTPSRTPAVRESAPESGALPPARRGEGYWHYCEKAQGYYPTVRSCPDAWILVAPKAHVN